MGTDFWEQGDCVPHHRSLCNYRLIVSDSRVMLARMGYEAVRMHARRGKIGSSCVRASGRFVDRGPRRRRYGGRVYGRRGANPDATLLGMAAVGVLVVIAEQSTDMA